MIISSALFAAIGSGRHEKNKKTAISSNVLRSLWSVAALVLFLTTLLSWWLLSGSWATWKSARNNVSQFDDFYHVLQVSNDLAGERAYANELVLSTVREKEKAWQSLEKSRRITNRDINKIPADLLSPALLKATLDELGRARQRVDAFRTHTLTDPVEAQQTINA